MIYNFNGLIISVSDSFNKFPSKFGVVLSFQNFLHKIHISRIAAIENRYISESKRPHLEKQKCHKKETQKRIKWTTLIDSSNASNAASLLHVSSSFIPQFQLKCTKLGLSLELFKFTEISLQLWRLQLFVCFFNSFQCSYFHDSFTQLQLIF